MAAKSDKGKGTGSKSAPKSSKETPKSSSKPKKQLEDDEEEENFDDEETETSQASKKSVKESSKKTTEEDDDEDTDIDEVDEWEKPEEEEDWDPDFDEFDLPKSRAKKTTGGKKGKGAEEEEVGFDDEFKDLDLFNDTGFDEDEEDF